MNNEDPPRAGGDNNEDEAHQKLEQFLEDIHFTIGFTHEDPYKGIPTSVIYDAFTDTETQLGGIYIHHARTANTPDERDSWWQKHRALRDERHSVAANDRESLISAMERWRAEIKQLQWRQP